MAKLRWMSLFNCCLLWWVYLATVAPRDRPRWQLLLATAAALVALTRPDDLLVIAAGLWLVGIAAMAAVVPDLSLGDMATDVAGWALSIALFAIVIVAAGFSVRLPQALGAIAGTGSVILFAQVVAAAVLIPLQGPTGAGAALEGLARDVAEAAR